MPIWLSTNLFGRYTVYLKEVDTAKSDLQTHTTIVLRHSGRHFIGLFCLDNFKILQEVFKLFGVCWPRASLCVFDYRDVDSGRGSSRSFTASRPLSEANYQESFLGPSGGWQVRLHVQVASLGLQTSRWRRSRPFHVPPGASGPAQHCAGGEARAGTCRELTHSARSERVARCAEAARRPDSKGSECTF